MNCDKSRKGKTGNEKYCSIVCQHDYEQKQWIAAWLAGRVLKVFPRRVKAALIRLRGEKCEICGWAERNIKTQNVPIELEHSDGNYENNSPENVKLLCPNCHALTPTFRNLNKGFGRKYRRNSLIGKASDL